MESEFRKYITIGEAAEYLNVCIMTLRRWDKAGKLKAVRHPINNYRLYRKVDLEKLAKKIK